MLSSIKLRNQRCEPFIIAHQGSRAIAPENSLDAFQLALEQGADAIETDLQITRDLAIICMHDTTVNRTTDGSGRIRDLSLSEIKKLRLRDIFGATHQNAGVPSIDEVLYSLASKILLILELKSPRFEQPDGVELLLATLNKYNAINSVLINSFSEKALRALNSTGVNLHTYRISAADPFPPSKYSIVGAWWPLIYLNPSYIKTCHKRGQIFYPLDAHPEPRLLLYLHKGVDGLITDNPLKTRQAIHQLLQSFSS